MKEKKGMAKEENRRKDDSRNKKKDKCVKESDPHGLKQSRRAWDR